MLTEKRNTIFAKLLLLVTTLIWGSSFFILKNTIDELPVFFVLAIRFALGAAMLGLVFGEKLVKTSKKTLFHGFLLGLTLTGAYCLQTLGLKGTTPGKNAFLTSAYVIMVPFAAWAAFRRKPKLNNILAAVLCLLGVGLVSLDAAFHVELGDILTVAGAVFYAAQIILLERYRTDEAGQILFFELLTPAAIFAVVSAATERIGGHVETGQLMSLLYLGLIVTGSTQLMQLVGQKYTPAASASIILSLESVFGVMFSMIFYHERLNLRLGMGFAVIFAAVLVSELNWTEIYSKIKRKIKRRESE